MPCSLVMSCRSNKASSTTEATWHPMPLLKSLSDASSPKGSPSCMGAGSQARGSGGWVFDLSKPRCAARLTFCYFAARWASSSWVRRDLPVQNHVLPFLLPSPLWIDRFSSGRLRWLRSKGRRLWRRRRKLRLSRLPRCTSPWLVLYQLHQTLLDFLFRSIGFIFGCSRQHTRN